MTRPRRLFRWAGAKGHLVSSFAPALRALLARGPGQLVSLFYGAGVLEAAIAGGHPHVGADANPDLLALYSELQRDPAALHATLLDLDRDAPRTRTGYLALRATQPSDSLVRAARFLWLNSFAFNGLWRVNRAGQHNVPADPARLQRQDALPDLCRILAAADLVRELQLASDWRAAAAAARPGDVVLADPPYLGGFVAYTRDGFSRAEQVELSLCLRDLAASGCTILAFNSPAAAALYEGWPGVFLRARSGRISADGASRQSVPELLCCAAAPGAAALLRALFADELRRGRLVALSPSSSLSLSEEASYGPADDALPGTHAA